MARRNISNRDDIPADALRQRRDLYAISIGLMLFYAAGGGFSQDANVGSIFAVHLNRPEFILIAAWAGLVYFWGRFWLITEVKPIADFLEDVRWQAGDSRTVRRIAAKYVLRTDQGSDQQNVNFALDPSGVVPLIRWEGLTPTLQLSNLWPVNVENRKRNAVGGRSIGPSPVQVNEADRRSIQFAWLRAIPRAAVRERTFSDYILPHLFALATIVVASVVCLHDPPETTQPRVTLEMH